MSNRVGNQDRRIFQELYDSTVMANKRKTEEETFEEFNQFLKKQSQQEQKRLNQIFLRQSYKEAIAKRDAMRKRLNSIGNGILWFLSFLLILGAATMAGWLPVIQKFISHLLD